MHEALEGRPAAQAMLREIGRMNGKGVNPSKWEATNAAKTSGMTRSYRYQVIDRLIEHGLVSNQPGPDARRYNLVLTPAGQRALAELPS